MNVCDEIFRLFEKGGSEAYYGEAVSMLEHALQAAHFARIAHAPDSLVVAALLHDIGHLVETVPGDIADWHTDAKHEEKGAAWLARHFGPEICNPVRLHVPAKRYLCATDPSYLSKLSPASVHTLGLQGGPMNAEEIAAFERVPHFKDATRVRRWDDAGKVAGLKTAGLEEYRKLIESAQRAGKPASAH
jgi:phosphonate degradation associated HDIG domain protein